MPSVAETSPPSDGNAFKVANVAHDQTWDYYWEQQWQWAYFVGFSNGFLFGMVGERHDANGNAWGHHDGLSYLGSAGNWNAWASTGGSSDIEPDYYYCETSNTNVWSKQTQTC